jgi:hypothetical protein
MAINSLKENWLGVYLEGLRIENLSSHWLKASAIFEVIATHVGVKGVFYSF